MSTVLRSATALLVVAPLAGCGVHPEPMMPTPVVYARGGEDPFRHLPAERQRVDLPVFYATNRTPERDASASPAGAIPSFGNTPSSDLHLGLATVRLGDESMTWSRLLDASLSDERADELILELDGVQPSDPMPLEGSTTAAPSFVAAVQRAIDASASRRVVIYVHGAKVDFYNACVFAAEVDHFLGRDPVAIAFAWPTHQDIVHYLVGEDVVRAAESAVALQRLIILLAERTSVDRIDVLSWSAGGRVTSRALAGLRDLHPTLDGAELLDRYRLGTVVFAASDVPLDQFVARLPAVHDLSRRVVVTISDADTALQAASRLMPGGQRAGTKTDRSVPAEEIAVVNALPRLEIVDVSFDQTVRGFDIRGHRYWFRHPWASSDVMVTLRHDLPPGKRGLEPTDYEQAWALPRDYPERVVDAVRALPTPPW